jgi:predicted phosphate transport protein (TIGR00153 family)
MGKVANCIEKLSLLIEVLDSGEREKIEEITRELSELEYEADLTQNDIRNRLSSHIFLPIGREQLLGILSIQDSIADYAEKVGLLLTLHPLVQYNQLAQGLHDQFSSTLEVFQSSLRIMREIEELLESSFGGIEAERVKTMAEEAAMQEHKARLAEHAVMKKLFTVGENMSPAAFYLWVNLLTGIGNIATASEKLANQIRMVLELK